MVARQQIERAISNHQEEIDDCEERISDLRRQIDNAEEDIAERAESIDKLKALLADDGDEVDIEITPSPRMAMVLAEMRRQPPRSLDEWRTYNQQYEAAALHAIGA